MVTGKLNYYLALCRNTLSDRKGSKSAGKHLLCATGRALAHIDTVISHECEQLVLAKACQTGHLSSRLPIQVLRFGNRNGWGITLKSSVFPITWEWREIRLADAGPEMHPNTQDVRGVGAGRDAQSSDDVSRLGSGVEFSPDVSDMRWGRVGMSLESSEDSDGTGRSADVSETRKCRGKGGGEGSSRPGISQGGGA